MSSGRRPTVFERVLLLFYPRTFRARFADELLRFWRLQRREPGYRRSRLGRLRFGGDRLLDALVTGVRLRLTGRSGADRQGLRRTSGTRGSGESGRDSRGKTRWQMGSIFQDVRYAARSLKGAPLYAGVAVLTLAVGIGANAAIFTVVDAVVLRPLPYDEPDALFAIQTDATNSSATSYPDFVDWQGRTDLFAGVVGAVEFSTDVRWDGEAEEVDAGSLSRNALDVLGVEPLLGRTFTVDEDAYGGSDAVLLSEGLWQRRFGEDPAVLGKTMTIGGEPYTIVGVLPASFVFPDPGLEMWTALKGAEVLADAGFDRTSRTLGFIRAVGRLHPGVDPGVAARALTTMCRQARDAEGVDHDPPTIRLQPLHDQVVGDVRPTMLIVFGSAGLVLLVACANLAGLALTRAASRGRELAVRAALGASRERLVSQMLAECGLLALLGGGAGLLVAVGLTDLLVTLAPPGLPRLGEVRVDAVVLSFTAALSIATGLGFGVLPALRASRPHLLEALNEGGRGSSTGGAGTRLQQGLVVAQVSMAAVLMTAAALLANSFLRLVSVDTGFDPENLLRVAVTLPGDRYEESAPTLSLYDRLLERVRGLPGVEHASATYSPPLARNELLQSIVPEGRVEDPDNRSWVGTVIVQTDYFRTVGIELLRGRGIDGTDRPDQPPVAVINETMARTFWPGEDPLGKRFSLTGGVSGSVDRVSREYFPAEPITVVGLVEDERRSSLAEAPRPEFYRPHTQVGWGSLSLMIRTRQDSGQVTRSVRRILGELDPTVAVREAVPMGELVSGSVAAPRFRTLLMIGFAGVAGLLAMLGVYAVMAYAVARRTREIGIRMALGAPAVRVRREVLTRGMAMSIGGLVVGLVAAAAGSRALASMLYDVSPTDPLTFVVVAAGLMATAGLASWLPARRASRVDPLRSLGVGPHH